MGSLPTSKTWLITGASQGLGLALSLAALDAGHKVTACARDPVKAATTHPELEQAGGKWLKLDVNSKETQAIVSKAADEVGGFDVVVNNAGFFLAGTIEELDEEEMQNGYDTMFWGPIRVLKGALPAMKARKSGTIVTTSSIFGFYPVPGGALYGSPKTALDLVQDTLKVELKPFNIRPISIIAGLYRTNVLINSKQPQKGFSESTMVAGSVVPEVLGSVGKLVQDPEGMPGDPAKFGERVVQIVDGTGLGKGHEKTTRFLLGRDAVKLSTIKMEELAKDFKATREIAYSTDFEGNTTDGVGIIADMVNKMEGVVDVDGGM